MPEPTSESGWRPDPDDPHVMRWWEGNRWGKDAKPRLVFAAEDQTRLLADQTRLLAEIRNDLSTLKTIVFVLIALAVVGVVVAIAVAATSG